MAVRGMYETVKQAFQDIVAPQLAELKGDMRRLDEKIDSVRTELSFTRQHLDEKLDSLRAELKAEMLRLDEKIGSTTIRLTETLEIRERLATLEAKLAART